MNSRIKLLQLFAAAILSILVTAACSNNDERTEFTEQINADGTYTYNIRIDCMIADSATDVTRANYSWENGTTLYLRFKNGSTYTAGTAVYNSSTGLWSLTTPSSLPVLTSESTCEAYYFKNNGSVTTSTITLTENTSCYQGTGSYTHPTGSDIYASVTLKPKNWRLRFRGSSGSSVTIVSNSSDISYYSSFNRTTGAFSTTKKDVKLTVASNGYTPYIYGTFLSPSTKNNITVKSNTNDLFYRTINGSTLQSKSSGYLTLPTSSNYSSNGWNMMTATMSSTSFTYTGGTKTLSISAPDNMAWTLSSNASSYVTLSKTSGTGNATVNVTMSNSSASYRRTATLTFKAGDITKTITISQGYKEIVHSGWFSNGKATLYVNQGDIFSFDYDYSGHSFTLQAILSGAGYDTLLSISRGSYNYGSGSGTKSYTFKTSGTYYVNFSYTDNSGAQYFYGRFGNLCLIHN